MVGKISYGKETQTHQIAAGVIDLLVGGRSCSISVSESTTIDIRGPINQVPREPEGPNSRPGGIAYGNGRRGGRLQENELPARVDAEIRW
jgi:hypothetical protein